MISRAKDREYTTRESPNERFAFSRTAVFDIDGTGAPFDMDQVIIPPGKRNFPHHSHAALWEMYYIVSGSAVIRMDEESHQVSKGDSIMCPPGVAHQIINESEGDVVYLVVSNDPPFDSCYYPDSGKMGIRPTAVWKGHPGKDRYFWTETDEEYYTNEE